MGQGINNKQRMSSSEVEVRENEFTYAMQLVTSTSLAMVLVNTIKLNVFETIAKAGSDAQLSAYDIASRLSILNKEAPDMLDRMLRLLASHSIVTCSQGQHESRPVRLYGLAPVAKYFIINEEGASLGRVMELTQDNVYINSWFKLKDSVTDGGIAFDKFHGTHVFEYMALDARFREVFNTSMVNQSQIVMKEILECYHGFSNIKCLGDVGGGLGVCLNMITSKYPTIKGINFDLPHVTQHAPQYPSIQHVEGDMFREVPKCDAIFMKWILHNWNDDRCTKLLKNCYEALPPQGKVIVVDALLPFLPDISSSVKVATQMDAIMMTQLTGGKERTYDEFLVLAKRAGFAGIRKECFVCNMGVLELYK